MQPTDFQRFHALMQGMAKLYDKDLDRVLLDVYWLALKGWELSDFEQAAGHLMGTSKFMPRPADFNELRKAGRMTAGEAWAQVLVYVRGGWYRWGGNIVTQNMAVSPPPDAVTEGAVQALGGYRVIAMTTDEQLPFLERRFCEHYETTQDVQQIRGALPELTTGYRQRVSGPVHVGKITGPKDWDA